MGSATYNCPKCGTSIKVQRGNNRDSARYAAFLESRGDLCHPCERAEFKTQHEERITAAAASPLNADLPVLVGTPKRVAWATALRLDALALIADARDAFLSEIADPEAHADRADFSDAARAELADAVKLITVEIRDRTEASAWIDDRDLRRARQWLERMRSELSRRRAALCPTFELERQQAKTRRAT